MAEFSYLCSTKIYKMSYSLRNFLLAAKTQSHQAISRRYLGSGEQSRLVWNGFFIFESQYLIQSERKIFWQ